MTPHLEKIARALFNADFERKMGVPANLLAWATVYQPPYFEDARAALSALLPPSEEMVEAMMGEISCRDREREECAAAFTAAINAILGDGEGAQ